MDKKNLDFDRIMQAAQDDENVGFCRVCGAEHDGIEPDARKVRCERCQTDTVYGAEELLLMYG